MVIDKDIWRKEIQELKQSLYVMNRPIPRETLYEIQHALIHILTAYRRTPYGKKDEFTKAIGHIRRAHLDFLKIQLREKHKELLKNKDADCKNLALFEKNLVQARVCELKSIGEGTNTVIEDFRYLIDPTKEYFTQQTENITLEARTAETALLFSEKQRELLWIWAQLEIVHTSLLEERDYSIVYNMIEAYFLYDNLENTLKFHITTLKTSIIQKVIQIDCDSTLTKQLANTSWPRIDFLINSQNNDDEQIAHEIINLIDEPFSVVMDFLGVKFTSLVVK